MTIGEFASATWLSPKALRLYEQKGLLRPESVGADNGYRRYGHEQIATARLITLLRRIDMPLAQIHDVVHATHDEQCQLIARYRHEDEQRHARRQSLARFVEHAAEGGSLLGDGQPDVDRFEIAARDVPATPVLTSTTYTDAQALPQVIGERSRRLVNLANDRGGVVGSMFVIYHGQVSWESDGPIEVCIPIGDDRRAHRVEAAHHELYTPVSQEDVQFPRILAAFDALHIRAADLGRASSAPPREVYTWTGDRPDCEVALPIAPSTG